MRFICFLLLLTTALSAAERPSAWAQPLSLTAFPNAFRVSDELYRSAQFGAEALPQIKALGIKTIVSLRAFHSDKDALVKTRWSDWGVEKTVRIRFNTWHPEKEDFEAFFKLLKDPQTPRPILVHCLHGADRTGSFCAAYRVAFQGWDKEAAIKEMREGGFGFHAVWGNLLKFLRKTDLKALKTP